MKIGMNTLSFRLIDVPLGEPFWYNGELYIRTETYEDEINCCRLTNGTLDWIMPSTSVYKADVEITVTK
jgi:hypothetical protein